MVRLNPKTQCIDDGSSIKKMKSIIMQVLPKDIGYDESDIIFIDLNSAYYTDDYIMDLIVNDIKNVLHNIETSYKVIIANIDDTHGDASLNVANAFLSSGFIPINDLDKSGIFRMIYVNKLAYHVVMADIEAQFIKRKNKRKETEDNKAND